MVGGMRDRTDREREIHKFYEACAENGRLNGNKIGEMKKKVSQVILNREVIQ